MPIDVSPSVEISISQGFSEPDSFTAAKAMGSEMADGPRAI
jgi:hypothetical protein